MQNVYSFIIARLYSTQESVNQLNKLLSNKLQSYNLSINYLSDFIIKSVLVKVADSHFSLVIILILSYNYIVVIIILIILGSIFTLIDTRLLGF